jgi:hypothetical protein
LRSYTRVSIPCPDCNNGRCKRCLGQGWLYAVEPVEVVARQEDRDAYVVTALVMMRVQEILSSGIAWSEHRARLQAAEKEARLQGRVDSTMRVIKEQLGLAR